MGTIWPASGQRTVAWSQTVRGGSRGDRTLREIVVSLPPMIADRSVALSPELVASLESAMHEIVSLDHSHGTTLEALGVLLLRNESVASSKIEHIEASLDDYARALHGSKANPSAISMVAATEALDIMIGRVRPGSRLSLDMILDAHRALMLEDPTERSYAGRLRDMQNWIGGSDNSPREALYIPPPPELVAGYLQDLLAFSNRDDLPVIVQAALAHAQFESIHPFTDGNGRIGRGLINAILRRRGATSRVVVPLASALVAHRERYFDLLDAYRAGDPVPIVTSFADASRIAAEHSRVSASRLEEFPSQWREMLPPLRARGATDRLLDLLLIRPVISADEAGALLAASPSSIYDAIERLQTGGVVRPLTDRKRNQVWGASLVLDELNDLGLRIGRAASQRRQSRPLQPIIAAD